jgi:hypothetical protein
VPLLPVLLAPLGSRLALPLRCTAQQEPLASAGTSASVPAQISTGARRDPSPEDAFRPDTTASPRAEGPESGSVPVGGLTTEEVEVEPTGTVRTAPAGGPMMSHQDIIRCREQRTCSCLPLQDDQTWS